MGRVQLVNSIIKSMILYNFHIYSWLISLLKTIDSWIRNFIWSGNNDKRKIVTVAWNQICAPLKDGGLRLKSVRAMNDAATL